MTPADVLVRVEEICAIKHDNEIAHSMVDGLYVDVLMAIADGSVDAKELAATALRAEDISFTRWYA